MEEQEEDELDELLETMLNRDSAGSEVCSSTSNASADPPPAIPNLGITFSFPGWGIDIHRDLKRQTSVVRHCGSENRGMINPAHTSPNTNWIELRPPRNGSSPVSGIPDEVLLRVFSSLESEKDLSASRQACRRWYVLCSSDCLWDKFVASANNNSPRWLQHKHTTLSSRISIRYAYSKRAYELLAEALDAWWDFGQPHGKYCSSTLCPLIRKLTLSDWCVFYEVLSSAFASRADSLANMLLSAALRKSGTRQQAAAAKSCNFYDSEALDSCDGFTGMEICRQLRSSWNRYISWVKLVSLHCADLNHAVRIERVRAVETPMLYNKGVICFRSQVFLSYRLRSVLQAGLAWLTAKESEGTGSEQDIELLCSLHHLLQELDVADDFTLPHHSFTQAKFRRCFLDGESCKDYSRAQIVAARRNYFN